MRRRWGEFRLTKLNAGGLGSGLLLLLAALAGPYVTVGATNIGKGASQWVQYALSAAGSALILVAVLAAWTPARVLWTGRGFVGAAPRLPVRLVRRPDVTKAIARALRPGRTPVALTGIGGVGKSTLAAGACHLWRVRRRFRDGVTWLEADPRQDPLALLADLARRVGLAESESGFATLTQGKDWIGAVLRRKRFLIALDNAWERGPLDVLIGLAPVGAIVFTTRQADLALTFAATQISVDELTQEQALELLSRWIGRPPGELPPEARTVRGRVRQLAFRLAGRWTGRPAGDLPPEARTLCTRVGNLALGVAMAGAMVAQGRSIADVLDLIEQDLNRVHAEMDPAYAHRTLRAAIEAGISDLPEARERHYEQLAVFERHGPFTREAAYSLWRSDLTEADTSDLLAELTGRSLLSSAGDSRYTAHDLQYEVLRQRLGPAGLTAAHRHLLDGFRIRYSDGWASSAADPYLADALAGHLHDAGLADELEELLADVAWVEARLARGQLPGLVSDFDFAPRPRSQQIAEAMRMSAQVLAADPSQLRGQLAGRLLDSTDPGAAVWALSLTLNRAPDPWLAPTTPALTPADPRQRGGYYAGQVTSVAVSPGGRAVTGSADGRLRMWDMSTGSLEKLVGSATGKAVRSLAMFSYGSRALAGGDDGALRIQDLSIGAQIAADLGHARPVTSVVITSEETLAITGSMDGTLRLWSLPTLAERLVMQTGPVLCAVAKSDGTVAVTGGRDGAIKVWDLKTGGRVLTLGDHSGPIRALALTEGETHVVTAGEDGTLRMWALAGGSRPVLESGSGPLTSIAVTPDASRAVTGGLDGAVRIWDLQVKREIAHWRGDSAIVSCALQGESPIAITVGQENGRPYRLELKI